MATGLQCSQIYHRLDVITQSPDSRLMLSYDRLISVLSHRSHFKDGSCLQVVLNICWWGRASQRKIGFKGDKMACVRWTVNWWGCIKTHYRINMDYFKLWIIQIQIWRWKQAQQVPFKHTEEWLTDWQLCSLKNQLTSPRWESPKGPLVSVFAMMTFTPGRIYSSRQPGLKLTKKALEAAALHTMLLCFSS